MQRRASDDRGAVLIFLAIALVGLIALAGLVLDGGRAYGERRQMQNAADAASMAATRQLDRYVTDQSSDARTILAAARDTAEQNGAERASVTCRLVRFDRSVIGPCPTGATMPQATKDAAAGVVVTTTQTQDTYFIRVVGNTTFTAGASATAQIGRAGGTYIAPFLVCGTAPGHVPQILLPDATSADRVRGERVRDRHGVQHLRQRHQGRRPRLRQPVLELPWQRQHGQLLPHPGRVGHRYRQPERTHVAARQLRERLQQCVRRRLRGRAPAVPAEQRARRQRTTAPTASTWVSSRSPTCRTTTSTRSSAAAPPSTRGGSWDRPIPTDLASSS